MPGYRAIGSLKNYRTIVNNGSYFGISHIQIVLAKAGYYSMPIPRPEGHGNYLLNFITHSQG